MQVLQKKKRFSWPPDFALSWDPFVYISLKSSWLRGLITLFDSWLVSEHTAQHASPYDLWHRLMEPVTSLRWKPIRLWGDNQRLGIFYLVAIKLDNVAVFYCRLPSGARKFEAMDGRKEEIWTPETARSLEHRFGSIFFSGCHTSNSRTLSDS